MNKDEYDRISSEFTEKGYFIKETNQLDHYFSPEKPNYFEDLDNKCIRVREASGKCYFSYKQMNFGQDQDQSFIDEYETEVDDKKQLFNILDAIGIKYVLTVDKQRLTFKIDDKFELVLDKVKELGYFVECELLKHEDTIENSNQVLKKFISHIGLDISRRNLEGYAYMYYNRNMKK